MGKQGVSQWAVFQWDSYYQIENRRNFSRFNKKVWTGQSIFSFQHLKEVVVYDLSDFQCKSMCGSFIINLLPIIYDNNNNLTWLCW